MTSRVKASKNNAAKARYIKKNAMPTNFKDYLLHLRDLQETDSRLRQLELELKRIPEQLETSGSDYLIIFNKLQEDEGVLKEMTMERQSLEENLKNATTQMQEREKRLYAIKTQKEYQATLKEIAQMKKESKDREERILALLEGGEKILQEITQLKLEAADKEGGYRQIETELKKRQETLEVERASLNEKRPGLLKALPPEVLKKYDLVRKRYADAVAVVRRGICQGCNMNIPPQVYNEMLKAFNLRDCPNCHRLIYAEVERPAEPVSQTS